MLRAIAVNKCCLLLLKVSRLKVTRPYYEDDFRKVTLIDCMDQFRTMHRTHYVAARRESYKLTNRKMRAIFVNDCNITRRITWQNSCAHNLGFQDVAERLRKSGSFIDSRPYKVQLYMACSNCLSVGLAIAT